jgi:hypothetical protein
MIKKLDKELPSSRRCDGDGDDDGDGDGFDDDDGDDDGCDDDSDGCCDVGTSSFDRLCSGGHHVGDGGDGGSSAPVEHWSDAQVLIMMTTTNITFNTT